MISSRRTQDDEDDLTLFLGSLAQTNGDVAEEVDELGRVIPRQNPTAARRDRRTNRVGRRANRARTEEDEGYSTDSSLPPSDEADFQTAMSKLHEKGKDVLEDVR